MEEQAGTKQESMYKVYIGKSDGSEVCCGGVSSVIVSAKSDEDARTKALKVIGGKATAIGVNKL